MQERFTTKLFKKGELLNRQSEICRQASFINEGLVRIFCGVDGKEISMGFVVEIEYISAYASFLVQQPSPENIDALEDCKLLYFSLDDIQAFYKSHPVFETFGRRSAEILFMMISFQTTLLLTMSPQERYHAVIQYQPFYYSVCTAIYDCFFYRYTTEHLSRLRKKMTGK